MRSPTSSLYHGATSLQKRVVLKLTSEKKSPLVTTPRGWGENPPCWTGTCFGASQNSRQKRFPSKPSAGPTPKTNREQRKMETGCVCRGWGGVEGVLLPAPTEQPSLGTRGGHVQRRMSAWSAWHAAPENTRAPISNRRGRTAGTHLPSCCTRSL